MRRHVLQSLLKAIRGKVWKQWPNRSISHSGVDAILQGMHIHPALSEGVEKAFSSLMSPETYHHLRSEEYGLPIT